MSTQTEPHLFERETELSELRGLVDGAVAVSGRLTVVEGAAGAGKSSLAAAAIGYAMDNGLKVLSASGSELEREFAFGAIRQLFEPLLAAAPPAERTRLLAGAAEPASWVMGPPPADGDPTRAQAGFAALHAIYWLAANVAAETPLLIVVDDAHWVDESSVRSLSFLARRIADVRIALLVAMRPAEPGSPVELLDELRAQQETLVARALSLRGTSEIVRGRLPDADDELCAVFHAASAGNPLYLQELLRALMTDGPVSATAVRQASVPSLGDRVMRRAALVGPEAPALATAMAVLGDGAALSVAAALAGLDEGTAAGLAHGLERIEVLAGEDPFAFVHPLVRRSVYDDLSVTDRDAAHTGAARLLRSAGASNEALAAHLGAVRPAGSADTVGALRDAAGDAMARAAPDAAIRWLHRALDEQATEPPREVLLHELAQVEVAGRQPAAIDHLTEALELASNPVLRARISVPLMHMLAAGGQWERGVTVLSAAIDDLGDHDAELSLELVTFRAVLCAYDPRLVASFERDRDDLRALARGESWTARALSVFLAATSANRGDALHEVLPLVEHGLRDGRLLAEGGAGGWAAPHALNALGVIEAGDRAVEVTEQIAAEARRSGAFFGTLFAPAARGWISGRRGDLVACEADVRTSLELLLPNAMALDVATALFWLKDAMLERPSLDDLAAVLESIELDPVFMTTMAGAMLLENRGCQRLRRGERAAGLADLRACAEVYGALSFGPTFSPWRTTLALALPADEHAAARTLVDEELALAAATTLARPHGVALRAAGLLEGGEDGIDLLRRSVATLEGSEARLELARSLVELGAALRRGQRRTEAREQLATGMDLAHRCGAGRLVARADVELHATGARPRRPTQSGVEALTPSEQRIARLAAMGRSNLEIAQELYVSLRTVETHLSHAYAKLGLSGQGSRAALTEALGASLDLAAYADASPDQAR